MTPLALITAHTMEPLAKTKFSSTFVAMFPGGAGSSTSASCNLDGNAGSCELSAGTTFYNSGLLANFLWVNYSEC